MATKLAAIPFQDVRIRDLFWAPRIEVVRRSTLAHCLEMLERRGYLENFRLAAKGERSGYSGPDFMDSDVYKVIEAASYSLHTNPDERLDPRIDAIIQLIQSAQLEDGYLNTAIQVKHPGSRWANLRDNHELYCAGHLIEAAVAHYQATGKPALLDVARRNADLICAVFGEGPGRMMGYPGHPGIELALIRLYKATSEKRYLNLARFFIETRGSSYFAAEQGVEPSQYDGTYWQDNCLIREHREMSGHAVRACYLFSGVADVAAQAEDESLMATAARVWKNAVQRRRFITGGIGSSSNNEGFTVDYDLPNESAYQETCASIALAMLSHRLALIYGRAEFVDVMESALFNAVAAGISLDGRKFFYTNPLEDSGSHQRRDWFDCACCPPNVARTLLSLGGYAYARTADSIIVNMYIQGSVATDIDGTEVTLFVKSDYPWDGNIQIVVKTTSPAEFSLKLRVPGWCESATARVNGQPIYGGGMEKDYIVVRRDWSMGDWVELNLEMPIRRMQANPHVADARGKVAFMRGPIVYCVEQTDHDVSLSELATPGGGAMSAEHRPNFLGGVTIIRADGVAPARTRDWPENLYEPEIPPRPVDIVAIPYCVWGNRSQGMMKVWLPTTMIEEPDIDE